MGPQPIAVADVNALLSMAGLEDPKTKLKYLRLIQRMDRVELKHRQEQMKKARSK